MMVHHIVGGFVWGGLGRSMLRVHDTSGSFPNTPEFVRRESVNYLSPKNVNESVRRRAGEGSIALDEMTCFSDAFRDKGQDGLGPKHYFLIINLGISSWIDTAKTTSMVLSSYSSQPAASHASLESDSVEPLSKVGLNTSKAIFVQRQS